MLCLTHRKNKIKKRKNDGYNSNVYKGLGKKRKKNEKEEEDFGVIVHRMHIAAGLYMFIKKSMKIQCL